MPANGAPEARSFRPAFRTGERFSRDAKDRPLVVFEGVHKAYATGMRVLRGVELSIGRGEFVFVTGPSGAGKSTMLRTLYGAEGIDEGRITFLGRDVANVNRKALPYLRRQVGIVFQDFKLVPTWTIFENVAIALEVAGYTPRIIRSRVADALERVGLVGRGDERVTVLSGGERQRVAIARAIVNDPALILADEPTGNLDPQLAVDILGLFEDLNRAGATVLFATHDRSLLEISPHRTLVLDDGRIHDIGAGAVIRASHPVEVPVR
jgi:cell division transport system ATP-binding protein